MSIEIEPCGDFELVHHDDIARIHYQHRDQLPVWTIYRPTTSDYPGFWSGRMHLSLCDRGPTNLVIVRPNLDEVRARLPYGLTCLMRDPRDDPVIEETWL